MNTRTDSTARRKSAELTEEETEEKKIGRPTIYSEEIATRICLELAEGKSLRSICINDDMPHRQTVHFWLLDKNKKEFLDQYAIARQIQAECLVDELMDIADDGSNDYIERLAEDGKNIIGYQTNGEAIARSRLRVDTRKWYIGKVLPRIYGDALKLKGDDKEPLQQTLTHKFGSWDELDERLKRFTQKQQ